MINPVFLRTFLTLAEARSFTRTAELLHMTQPGVSQHLAWLEEYFRTELAYRDKRLFELTDAGRSLVAYGEKLFREHEEFRGSLGKDDPHAGLCRFASPGSFGMRMYSFLLDLNEKHPGLAIHYAYAPNPSIIKDVLDERIDVGFVTKVPEDAQVEATEMEREKLRLVVPASLKKVTWENLIALGFINHPDGHHHAGRLLSRHFPDRFRSMDVFPIRGFSNQITRILEPVARGFGFTALPEHACKAFPERARIRIVKHAEDVEDPVFWVQKRGRRLPARFAFIRHAMWS